MARHFCANPLALHQGYASRADLSCPERPQERCAHDPEKIQGCAGGAFAVSSWEVKPPGPRVGTRFLSGTPVRDRTVADRGVKTGTEGQPCCRPLWFPAVFYGPYPGRIAVLLCGALLPVASDIVGKKGWSLKGLQQDGPPVLS